MNEERANAGRILGGVEQGVLRESGPVAAEHGPTPAPASATHDLPCVLDDEISAVADKLAVHAKNRPQRRLHLRDGIVWSLQDSHRKRDKYFQSRHVLLPRQPDG